MPYELSCTREGCKNSTVSEVVTGNDPLGYSDWLGLTQHQRTRHFCSPECVLMYLDALGGPIASSKVSASG